MSRYTQDTNFLIKGPGLPEQGVVAVGVDELDGAFESGVDSCQWVFWVLFFVVLLLA